MYVRGPFLGIVLVFIDDVARTCSCYQVQSSVEVAESRAVESFRLNVMFGEEMQGT
jgi:hypothetical protein